jgi:Response regulator receiver domain/Phosphotransferase enzyme family
MRILLIEDESAQVDAVTKGFDATFFVATNRDDALKLIAEERFDVAVCDLKIPPSLGAPSDVEHGLAVLTAVRDRCAGTPVITFTAYKTKEVLDLFVREQRQEDYLGTNTDRPMLRVMEKDELPELLAHLEELRVEFDALEDIEVASGLDQDPPDWATRRVVQVFARRRECVIARIVPLTGGLSGVPVLRVQMERGDGASGGAAVARMAPIAVVMEERTHFQQRVSGVLPLGSYAEILDVVRAGASGAGAVFYQVAEDAEPLWALPVPDDARAAAAVETLRVNQERWAEGAPAQTAELRAIRRILIADDRWMACAPRCGLSISEVKALEVTRIHIRSGTVHGDLHGANILVGTGPVLIDFASVTSGPTPLDPVSLELSLLFHPDAPSWHGDWPTLAQLEQWPNLAEFVEDCPFPAFVRACRAWATALARGDRDVVACAYAYVASQARFDTSRDDRLTAIMRSVRSHLA